MKLRSLKKNKRGNAFIPIAFAGVVGLVLLISLLVALGSGIITYTSRTITNEISDLGMIGETTNLTEIVSLSVVPVNTAVQQLQWFSGVVIAVALISILLFAYYVRANDSKIAFALFFFLAFILIITSIFVSNIYEEMETGTDEMAVEYQNQTLARYLVIYMPEILTVILFIGAAIMFTGIGKEEFI